MKMSQAVNAKWRGMLASGALLIGLVGLSSVAQDAAVNVQAPPANGKPKVVVKAAVVTLNLYDASGKTFITVTRKVAKKTNAFDFLRETLNVDFATFSPDLAAKKPFPGGPFVNALAGVPPDSGTYWALYVNNKYSCVGIGAVTIDQKDILIEWKMEKFEVNHPECD